MSGHGYRGWTQLVTEGHLGASERYWGGSAMTDGGLEVRLNNCDLVAKEIRAATRRALETIGLLAEGYAKDKCPVGTPESTGIPSYVGGTLRNSSFGAVSI